MWCCCCRKERKLLLLLLRERAFVLHSSQPTEPGNRFRSPVSFLSVLLLFHLLNCPLKKKKKKKTKILAACLCREHWPPRHRVALRRCCELATAPQRCHDACFSVATLLQLACCNTAAVTRAAAALLRRLLQPCRYALATGATATTLQRCRDESCRNSVAALSRRVLQQRRCVARRELQQRELALLQCSAAARHRRSGGEALHVRRKLDFRPWDFRPRTFVRQMTSVHGQLSSVGRLPSIGPIVLSCTLTSCTLTSYVLLSHRPVLHPDVLRHVVLRLAIYVLPFHPTSI